MILLDRLFEQPMITVNRVAEVIDRSYPVANDLVSTFESLGLL
ncbi:MAG: Fic family protein, partial [Gemmatimonadetes bacterium]|nr:Fic family protein [Gemmatimonadota bacterium]NIR77453.1 Fic family protein [Gemmatimonadota bacterium]NIT85977.1 Fic family protein [Gemmatimonadota bacterium]NIU29797.1 Fic family protein [Gemmatimonadota bacterium]NIU34819.1 Fic family protein [Gemmatimonadota bacterium]